jgi:arginyl-tRNA synthetase
MSTRAGNVIFLTDILDEARERMLELIHRNEAKLAEVDDPHHVAEVMGQ